MAILLCPTERKTKYDNLFYESFLDCSEGKVKEIFINQTSLEGCDTRSIFKQNKTDSNLEFSFS